MSDEAQATEPIAPVEPVEAPAQPADAPAPAAPTEQPSNTITLTEEQKTFLDNNGGWEKFFERGKTAISRPERLVQPEQPAQPQYQQPQYQQPQYQAPQAPSVGEGYLTPKEMNLNRYLNDIASSEKYAPIREYMSKEDGKQFLEDLDAFNIEVMDDNGNVNDAGIRRFLDLKVQTVPAQQTSVEPTNIPTADYYNVEEIKSRDEAFKIIQDSIAHRGKGEAENPQYEAAMKFLKENK